MQRKEIGGMACLVLAALIWGFAFVSQVQGMDSTTPLFFGATRFTLGSISLIPLLWFRRNTIAEQERKRRETQGKPSITLGNGAIVAMPGNGWKPQGEWIQLQLSGGSIPGKEIEAITQEGSTLVVRLKKPNSDMETMDLCLTEYRVAGGDVSSVESVVVEDKGERLEAQLGVDGEARAVQ